MGFFSKIFGGGKKRSAPEPPKIIQAPTMTPAQKKAMDEILQLSLTGIRDPYKGFEPIASQARSKFAKETIPSLAERFTAMGGGAQRSSGFQEALGGSATGLEEMLAALMSQYGLQSLGAYGNLAGLGAKPQFENIVQAPEMQAQSSPGMLQGLLGMGGLSGISRLFRRF